MCEKLNLFSGAEPKVRQDNLSSVGMKDINCLFMDLLLKQRTRNKK